MRTFAAQLLLCFGAKAEKQAKTHHNNAFHPKGLQWKH
jgi:hypothetical protein